MSTFQSNLLEAKIMKKNKSLITLLILSLSLPIFAMAQGHHDRPHHGDHRQHHGDHRQHHGRHYYHHGHPGKYLRWSIAWWAPVAKPCYYWHGHCHGHPRYFW